MHRSARLAPWLSICALLTAPATASAFCGFYVGSDDAPLQNERPTVVLYRDGDLTVLTMRNDYRGPRRDFALVVPVPTVIERRDVRVLPRDLFHRVDTLAAPRLVRYEEPDPCGSPSRDIDGLLRDALGGSAGPASDDERHGVRTYVRVERRFDVGEYEIVVLGANDSGALEEWLRSHGYRVPAGAARHLRPYVEGGSRFFVARVRAEQLRGGGSRRVLSPISVRYTSPQLELPVQLGRINSRGTQDLVVHVLASSRVELANRPNVLSPTNVVTAEATFSEAYAARLEALWAEQPDAAVTEYAWNASACDPCPTAPLDAATLAALQGPRPRDGRPERQLRVEILSHEAADRRRLRLMVQRRPSAAVAACLRRYDLPIGTRGRLALRPDQAPRGRAITQEGRAAGACLAPSFANAGLRHPAVLSFQVVPSRRAETYDVVLTRVHLRIGRAGRGDDLVFRAARPLAGGGGEPDATGQLPDDVRVRGATPNSNSFQTRWAELVPFRGPVRCESPRPRWSIPAPPNAGSRRADLAPAPQPVSMPRPIVASRPAWWSWVPQWMRAG